MNNRSLVVIVLGLVMVCCAVPGTVLAAAQNSINVGGGGMVGPDTTATAFFVEYERLLGSRMAIFGRGGSVNYTFDDGWYVEDGTPKGFDIGVRAYPMGGGGMKGMFIGGAIGYWNSSWTFTDDKGQTYETKGEGDSTAIRADLEFGGRFNLGSETVSILPALHIGHYFSLDNSCKYTSGSKVGQECTKESEVGLYGFVSVTLGFAF